MNSQTPLPLRILLKMSAALMLAGVAIGVTVIIVSPFIWYMNEVAQDGPIFPPPLVALGFFGLPLAVLLFPMQLCVVLYELFRGKPRGAVILVIAIVNGLLAGLLWFLVMTSGTADIMLFLTLVGVALLQSFVVHGLYWLWERYSQRYFKAVQYSDQ